MRCKKVLAIAGLLLLFAVSSVLFSLILGFSGLFPALRVTLTETFSVSRGTQFIVNAFCTPDEIDAVMEQGLYRRELPAGLTLSDFADPAEFTAAGEMEAYALRGQSFVGHALVIPDPTSVELLITPELGTRGLTLSEFNERTPLAAGINASGYLDNDTLLGEGGNPSGAVICRGELICDPDEPGTPRNLIGLTREGVLLCGSWTLDEAQSLGIYNAVSFRPAVVLHGEGLITSGTGGYGYAPRSAIGQRRDGAILFVVLEGRRLSSIGATLLDVQEVLLSLGAYTGCLLDGGSCSTLVYNNARLSRPVDLFGERPVPTAFGVRLSEVRK